MEEEVMRQIGVWTIHMADQLWPGDGDEGSWSDRVWQSLREDQDPTRITTDLHPIEEILDTWVEFALPFLRNSRMVQLAFLEGVTFHTQEFARLLNGSLTAEIMEHADQLWAKGSMGRTTKG